MADDNGYKMTSTLVSLSRLLSRWTSLVLNWQWVVLVILSAISVAAASQLRYLRTEVDLSKILPTSDPYVLAIGHIKDLFGGVNSLMIGVKFGSGTICSPNNFSTLEHISQGLSSDTSDLIGARIVSVVSPLIDDIQRVGDEVEVRNLADVVRPSTDADSDRCMNGLDRATDLKGILWGDDGRTAVILIEFNDKKGGYRQLIDSVRASIEKHKDATFSYQLGGNVAYIAETERYSERIPLLLGGAVVVIGLLLYFSFRSLQGVFIPLASAILATLWALGVLGALRVALDAFSSLTPILILVVAAGHSVQLLKRFYEEYDGSGTKESVRKAVIASVARAGPATVAAGGSAALGFLSLLNFDIASIRTFGLFTATGIASAVVIELTLIPILRALLPAPNHSASQSRVLDGIFERLAEVVVAKRRIIIMLSMAIATGCGWAASTLVPDNSIKRYFSPTLAVYRDDQDLNTISAGTNYFLIHLHATDGGSIVDPEVLGAIADLDRWLSGRPGIGKVYGINKIVQRLHQAWRTSDAPGASGPPASREEAAQLLLLYSFSDQAGLSRWLSGDERDALMVAYLKTDSTEEFKSLVPDVQEWMRRRVGDRITLEFSGTVLTSDSLNKVMVQGKIRNLVQLVLAIGIVAALLFRSVAMGIIVVLPLILSALTNFAVVAAMGFPLNVPASLSTALAVGVGADFSIYLLVRLIEEQGKSASLVEALTCTYKTAGRAIMLVSFSIAAGYAVLLVSRDFYPHSLLGGLISVSMVTACVFTIALVPAVASYFLSRPQLRR